MRACKPGEVGSAFGSCPWAVGAPGKQTDSHTGVGRLTIQWMPKPSTHMPK